ncbi:MAG: helix-turn-helix transcriptional regulator [Oscillospiraceae bacterium]|nr:helix-turn-helix domain-containing protein [Oscillospiraceae bacterium]MDD7041925.1 helix-turn-helix transcriptional regulator [Oscillospiraceae bacterium]MDY2611609.1 helix-turn-helix transcriptional regulator [Oscillospiraceae bacterium]
MLNQNLSAKLKNHRKSVWMTQKQLSDKSGVSLTEIRNIERQRTNASLDTVDLLADALEISPIELLK